MKLKRFIALWHDIIADKLKKSKSLAFYSMAFEQIKIILLHLRLALSAYRLALSPYRLALSP
jgi:hypothetical protein